ncbi:ABC transporter permease [Parapedobacter deserti]|uniref:ABC transporter permease n=1 Tax=Parapedobacter deserti TaxID=1912957 RepID=A0ABV7JDF4_9SPHI
MTAASLIFLWMEDEVSYDEFPNKENSYIVKSKQTFDGISNVFDGVPGLLGPAIKEEIPGIKYAARVAWKQSSLFSVDDQGIYQKGYYAEPDFMDIFALQFVEGDRATAIKKPNDLVTTQSTAERLFGKEPALGKTVRIDNKDNHLISGVVKDLPKNSTYQFDWLAPFEAYENQQQLMVRQWLNFSLMTFVPSLGG